MIGIVKGDIRYNYLAKELNAKIASELYDFYDIDVLILPLGGIDEYYNIKQSNLNILDIFKQNEIKKIVVGNANNKLKDLCDKNQIVLYELLKDNDFVIANAKLTAMGIIDYLNRKDEAICDQKLLILGFGNISFKLAELLKSYGTKFSIYPANQIEEKFINLCGYKVSDFKDFDLVINTIPSQFEADYAVFQNKQIIDVASSPYGFDLDKLNGYSVNYQIYSAIPSKFAYISAAKLIQKALAKNCIIDYN